jgi:hypothetical protein
MALPKNIYSPLEEGTSEYAHLEDEAPWDNYPIEIGTSVVVEGRTEAGDVPAISGQTGVIHSYSYSFVKGSNKNNTVNVIIDSVLYTNIDPRLVTEA